MKRVSILLLSSALMACGSSDEGSAPVTPAEDSSTTDTATTPADTNVEPSDTGVAIDSAAPDAPAETTAEAGPVACTDAGGKIFSGNGHCYFPLPAGKTLVGAANECKTKMAHIVTITSGEEQDFLKDLGTGERWIGLTSMDPTTTKSDFDWLGGEAVTYDGWNAGSPASRGRCAVILSSGKWEDRSCSDELRIGLCERE